MHLFFGKTFDSGQWFSENCKLLRQFITKSGFVYVNDKVFFVDSHRPNNAECCFS